MILDIISIKQQYNTILRATIDFVGYFCICIISDFLLFSVPQKSWLFLLFLFSTLSKWQSIDIMSGEQATGARGGLFGAGGRFKGGTDPIMEKFNESIGFDKR